MPHSLLPFLLHCLKILCLLFFCVSLEGCATGSCHSKKDRSVSYVNPDSKDVWIYKYNGSMTCSKEDQSVKLETMAKELAGIKILESAVKKDGLVRITLCGIPTGTANTYRIPKKQLPEALERGFYIWNFGKK